MTAWLPFFASTKKRSTKVFNQLKKQIAQFRIWGKTCPYRGYINWEYYYEWDPIYDAFFKFLHFCPVGEWTLEVIQELIYIIARDGERGTLIRELGKNQSRLEVFANVVSSLLMEQIAYLRVYANKFPADYSAGLDEWQINYKRWDKIDDAFDVFIQICPIDGWTQYVMHEVIYVIGADQLRISLIHRLAKEENRLLCFAASVLSYPDHSTRWQTVQRLADVISRQQDAEELLLKFIEDDHEYVRRSAMNALGRIGSSHVERLADQMWNSCNGPLEWKDAQEYARGSVLYALAAVNSNLLNEYLIKANADGREMLVLWSTEIEKELNNKLKS